MVMSRSRKRRRQMEQVQPVTVERRGEGLSKHGGGAAAEKSTGDGGSKEGEVTVWLHPICSW
jgi:hypothetical protein